VCLRETFPDLSEIAGGFAWKLRTAAIFSGGYRFPIFIWCMRSSDFLSLPPSEIAIDGKIGFENGMIFRASSNQQPRLD
jgi:hypothetical protein